MNTPQFEVQHWADILDDNNDWKGLLEVGHVRHNTPGNDHISFAILTRVGPKVPGKMAAQEREIVAAKLTASDRERAQFFIDTLDLWEKKMTEPEEEKPEPPPEQRYQLQLDPHDPLNGLIVEVSPGNGHNGVLVARTLGTGAIVQRLVMYANAGFNNL